MGRSVQDPGRQEYVGLQVLRAGAALAVVAGHSNDYLLLKLGSVPRALSWVHGPAGVDVFFVISGFVMMLTVARLRCRSNPAKSFFVRRLIRIVPLYWLLTLIKVITVLAKPGWTAAGRPSNWNMVASFLFIPSIGASGEIRPVIPVAWTLSFEMFFYVLFALALILGSFSFEFLAGSVVLVAMLGLMRIQAWPAWTAPADPIVVEFLAGVWLAKLTLAGRLPGKALAWAMVLAGTSGMLAFQPAEESWKRPASWGVCAVLIVLGTVALEGWLGLRVPQWLLLLGDASYSIYLAQTFVFPLLHKTLETGWPLLVQDHPLRAGVLLMATSVVTVAGVGVGLYWLVERPMTAGLRRMIDQPRLRAVLT